MNKSLNVNRIARIVRTAIVVTAVASSIIGSVGTASAASTIPGPRSGVVKTSGTSASTIPGPR